RRRVRATRRVIVELAQPGITVTDEDATVVAQSDGRAELAYDPSQVAAADLVSRLCARYPVRDLTVENEPIERVVARLYHEGDTP
ncbi:MAG: ABC transporter, partial [Anaerolineae bacterium]